MPGNEATKPGQRKCGSEQVPARLRRSDHALPFTQAEPFDQPHVNYNERLK